MDGKKYLIDNYQMPHKNEIDKMISLNNFIEYINSEFPKLKKANIYSDALERFLWETIAARSNEKENLQENAISYKIEETIVIKRWNYVLSTEQLTYIFNKFFKNEINIVKRTNNPKNINDRFLYINVACHKNCPLSVIIIILDLFSFINDSLSIERILFNNEYRILSQLQENSLVSFNDLQILYNADNSPNGRVRKTITNHPNFTMQKMLEDFVNS